MTSTLFSHLLDDVGGLLVIYPSERLIQYSSSRVAMKTTTTLLSLLILSHASSVSGFQPLAPPVMVTPVLQRSTRCSVYNTKRRIRPTKLSVSIHSEVDPVVRKRRLATWLAFLTGMADVALSLQFQTFATMLTGNLMWLSRAISEGNIPTVCYYLSVFVSYLTGLSVVRSMRNENPKTILRGVGLAVATLFVGADWLFYGMGLSRWIPVCMLAAAYGGINSIGTDFAGTVSYSVVNALVGGDGY